MRHVPVPGLKSTGGSGNGVAGHGKATFVFRPMLMIYVNIYGGTKGPGREKGAGGKVKGDANDLLKKFIRHGQISGEFTGEVSTRRERRALFIPSLSFGRAARPGSWLPFSLESVFE